MEGRIKGKHALLDVDEAMDGRRRDVTQTRMNKTGGGSGDDERKDAAEYQEDEGPRL